MEICKFIVTIWSFLTEAPLLAAATIYFAWQQVKISKMQRSDNLYDKRYFAYEKYREFAQSIIDKRNNFVLHLKLLSEAMLHEFLFNDDIKNFSNKTRSKYNEEIGSHLLSNSITFTDNMMTSCVDEKVRKQY
jgi:hypothetical protein